ncbi:hypothetical protein NDU88_003314 [Pleurodeles waltl]|uniref:Uncharacterized protein n=1 Tax=Pleurodeles waltl TaxID=8319 RepID=A0AAV7QCL5_PLEWA|nr:hypothetical protein NDU88_003314 [Pleurodeles waltl]
MAAGVIVYVGTRIHSVVDRSKMAAGVIGKLGVLCRWLILCIGDKMVLVLKADLRKEHSPEADFTEKHSSVNDHVLIGKYIETGE